MDIILTPIEARVLGSLIEKEITTPDYYPLTLNALTNACNQKSNRDPVMNLDEKKVVRALNGLREKKILWQKNTANSRVPKYAHRIREVFEFYSAELGTICVLLLRGPQTVGEIYNRTIRLCEFKDLDEVEATLQMLMERKDGPFVLKLPRQPGQRECRYAHLFCGEVDVEEKEIILPMEAAAIEVHTENERIMELEKGIAALRTELDKLRQEFFEFKKQFE